jgi:RNA polymerase sigma-70 factor (ECF subfamily)
MEASARPFAIRRQTEAIAMPAMGDLLRRISQQRDTQAFRELFHAYGPRIKAYMMRKGVEAQAAEDLAQETMLTVWRKASLYSVEKGNATTWIFTIARNLRVDRVRRSMSFQPLPEGHQEQASAEPSPEAQVATGEIETRVRAALGTLPADQREIIVLAYVEGLSQTEIAERLAVPLGTVKSRMRLAYQKVRTALEDLQ